MTASTQPLVDVIEAAIEEHTLCMSYSDNTGIATNTCTCGNEHLFKIEEPYDRDGENFRQHAAHQAGAVLDALTKAGGVEVVTGYGVKLKSGDVERCGTNVQDAKDWLEDSAGGDHPDYRPVEVVTRTTTTITIRTDWTAVKV